jgi:uncharacterized protein YyaL (SSP411 family)
MNRRLPSVLSMAIVASLIASANVAVAAPAVTDAQPVLWRTYDQAVAEAAESGQPIMIHFTAAWCRWCVKMKKETYTDPTVAQIMGDGFVTAMVDTDKQPDLGARFGVESLPTVWFLTAQGEPITYAPGFLDAPTLRNVLRWVRSGAYATTSYEDFVGGGK